MAQAQALVVTSEGQWVLPPASLSQICCSGRDELPFREERLPSEELRPPPAPSMGVSLEMALVKAQVMQPWPHPRP